MKTIFCVSQVLFLKYLNFSIWKHNKKRTRNPQSKVNFLPGKIVFYIKNNYVYFRMHNTYLS